MLIVTRPGPGIWPGRLIMVVAAIVGATAALWCWARGQQPASAISAGGSAFGATILVLLAVFAFLNATGDSGH
jgi:hypothetical protein